MVAKSRFVAFFLILPFYCMGLENREFINPEIRKKRFLRTKPFVIRNSLKRRGGVNPRPDPAKEENLDHWARGLSGVKRTQVIHTETIVALYQSAPRSVGQKCTIPLLRTTMNRQAGSKAHSESDPCSTPHRFSAVAPPRPRKKRGGQARGISLFPGNPGSRLCCRPENMKTGRRNLK